jgi:hypothetical protein
MGASGAVKRLDDLGRELALARSDNSVRLKQILASSGSRKQLSEHRDDDAGKQSDDYDAEPELPRCAIWTTDSAKILQDGFDQHRSLR